jgi:uncharacterized protein (TIGR03435 family)
VLIFRNICFAGVLALTALTTWAQTSSAAPTPAKQKADGCPPPVKFRSVSIHARDTVYAHADGYTNEGFSMRGVTLRSVIASVFSTQRIEGLPDWAQKQTYDVIAEIDPEDCCPWSNESPQEESLTVQGFLQDKLKLKWHKETRMIGAFDLVVGKSGPKFAPAQPEAKRTHEIDEFSYLSQLNGTPITMEELAEFLSFPGQAGHPVVDKTGLAGRYVLSGRYRSHQVNDWKLMEADGTPVQPASGATIFDDVQVLGLELKGTKIPVDVLVIDQIERPTEN